MTNSVTLELAQSKRISTWNPKHGDFVYYKGWLSSWVGLVSGIDPHGSIAIIIAGTPVELLSYSQKEMDKNMKEFDILEIRRKRAAYAAFSIENGVGVWYV